MKKFIPSIIIVFAALVFNATSCKPDEPHLEANPTTVTFTQEGGTETINLTTNSMSWTASVSGKGFSVSPTSGSGNTTLTLTAAVATSADEQKGTLTVKSGTLQATISITQGAKNTLIASGNNTIEHAGGNYSITLQYNTNYTVTIEESAKSWIQYTGTKALSSATLAFQVAANTGPARTGIITIKDNAGIAAAQNITLNQKENPLRTDLMALYDALGGTNWAEAKKTNWNSAEPIETWGGVTVTDGIITKLNLSGFGLKGQLPEVIGSFTDITSLNLGSNPDLTGPLPQVIGNLIKLETLNAVTTGLQGPLPASMGNLLNLTNLQLNKNNISGTIPVEWAGMTALKNFGMYETQLSGPLPDAIFTGWKHIGTLLLNDNPKLTGELPEALGNMTTDNTIFNVQLHNCNFTGGIPESWGNIPEVSKQLYLYGNKLTYPVPLAIQNHPSWTPERWNKMKDASVHYLRSQQNSVYLELEEVPDAQRELLMSLYNALDGANWVKAKKTNWGSDEDISTWGGVTVANDAITRIDLSGFGLKGSLPEIIGDFSLLTYLNLSSNPTLTGSLPSEIGTLSNLTTFLAETTGLEGSLPAAMGSLQKLTNLQLNNNNITGTIPAEWAGMTALKNFSLSNTKISGPLPAALFTGWKHIGSLMLHSNPNLTGSLPEAIGNMTTDNTGFNVHLYDCNFTGGIPESWGNIPAVSAELRLYGNKLTEPVPAAIIAHPSWTTDKWNSTKPGTTTHYIRTQQNGVYLALDAIPPTVSEITVTELTYNKISVKATVENDGGENVTVRGFIFGTTNRKVGAGTGDFSASFTGLNSNTTYTVKAYATNAAGTTYSAEKVITTPFYSELNLTLTGKDNQAIAYTYVYLTRIGDNTTQATAEKSASSVPGTRSGHLSASSADEALRKAAGIMAGYLKPFAAEIIANRNKLKQTLNSTSVRPRLTTKGTETVDYTVVTNANGMATVADIRPGLYAVRMQTTGYVPFYAQINVPQGDTAMELPGVPTLEVTLPFISVFKENTATRAFASSHADDNILAIVNMDPSAVASHVGKRMDNLVFCPMDTTSSLAIIALTKEDLEATYAIFDAMIDDEGHINTENLSQTELLSFMQDHARRLVMISQVTPCQTNTVSQPDNNFKKIMFSQMDSSVKNLLLGLGITEDDKITIAQNKGLVINMIISQQGTHPVLLTDGAGPAVSGGNLLGLTSNTGVSTLSDVGYQGNWHLGATLK